MLADNEIGILTYTWSCEYIGIEFCKSTDETLKCNITGINIPASRTDIKCKLTVAKPNRNSVTETATVIITPPENPVIALRGPPNPIQQSDLVGIYLISKQPLASCT